MRKKTFTADPDVVDTFTIDMFEQDAPKKPRKRRVRSSSAPVSESLVPDVVPAVKDTGSQSSEDAFSLWMTDPVSAYERWIGSLTIDAAQNTRYQPKSTRQFVAMFGRFARWLIGRGLDVATFDAQHIQQFLLTIDSRGQAPARSTVRRYLAILERVCTHLNSIGVRNDPPASDDGVASNPGRELLRHNDYRFISRERPAFLTVKQSEQYIQWVIDQPNRGWVDVRDRAFRLVFLSSGPTVEDVRCLRVEDALIGENGLVCELRIRPRGVGHPARTIPVADWAQRPLTDWLELRRGLFSPSDALFLARSKDFRIDEPGVGAIGATESFTVIQEAMAAIGYMGFRQGPMTLRHSFTVRQLMAGVPKERINEWLGLSTMETVSFIEAQLPTRGGVRPV